MGRYVIRLSELAEGQAQDIFIPITLPGYTLQGGPHGQVRLVVRLVPTTGGITVDVETRDEDCRMIHHMKYGFWPRELIHDADRRRKDNNHH